MGGPFHMPALALLAGIALFFAALFARLAVLAALLLLLLATLFLVALLLVLVGVVSHFASPAVAPLGGGATFQQPAPRRDVARPSPGRGGRGTDVISLPQPRLR